MDNAVDGLRLIIITMVIGIIFLMIIVIAQSFGIFSCGDPGTGQQIGYVAEVENSGIIWRPDEIVIIGSEATFSSSQTSWNYGSISPEITEQARKYLKNHEKVIVSYETQLIAFGWDYSNPSIITKITPIEEKEVRDADSQMRFP